ncbi:MAG: prenyltransferase/squalene oxidase repeat-containing protein [Thermoguttaceae bacterium]
MAPTPADAAADDADEEPKEDVAEIVLKSAPPWLVSALVHTVLMIVMAIALLPQIVKNQLVFETVFADSDRLGDQLEFDSPLAGNDPEGLDEPILTPDDLPLVSDPFAAPPKVDLEMGPGRSMVSDTASANIGIALDGRQAGTKKALIAAYGGTKLTEAAVLEGLKWLARNQNPEGFWSLVGPYSDGARNDNREAATAMALLAFQGDGNTAEYGEFKDVVKRGWYYLLKQQDADGCFYVESTFGHRFYTHGQATIAICELYAMTKDPALRSHYKEPAEKAIAYCVKSQSPMGGWKYTFNGPSDMSVTGWIVMALQSARMAGLEVPAKTLDNIRGYLDRMGQNGGSRYPYEMGQDPTRAMTAEGLLCRQYLGWKRNNPGLLQGVEWLLQPENQLSYTGDRDVYYWYYATQVMHHMEGEPWQKWNKVMCQEVPKAQVQTGVEKGSWDPFKPVQDEWGGEGGRLYVTCLSIYMLEVYYRHLPLYSNPFMYLQ